MTAFLEDIRSEIGSNPTARKMNYPGRLEKKIEMLLGYFPEPRRELRFFFEAVLYNVSVKHSDLENLLKFMKKLPDEKREVVRELFGVVWHAPTEGVRSEGLSEDKARRECHKKTLVDSVDALRQFAKATQLTSRQIRQVKEMRRRLRMDIHDVLKTITVSPRILRGLKKPPRPIYAWIVPVGVAFTIAVAMLQYAPNVSMFVLYPVIMGIIAVGVFYISTRVAIAPGILTYKKTREYLSRIVQGIDTPSSIDGRMAQVGIDTEEYHRSRVYENPDKGVRIVIRDKRTLEGAVKFLTSSEEIGSCIALRHFVAWTLPALLADNGIVLADIYHKGSRGRYQQRGQMWMIAAETNGEPVLTVNSFEFNNEGAKHIDALIPEGIRVLQDVAGRAHFKRILIGISDFGRDYLDAEYEQGHIQGQVRKIHSREAGYRYYFDAYRLDYSRRSPGSGREYVYDQKRGFVKRAYAVIFGLIEPSQGNVAKAKAFFDSAGNSRNCWEVPLDGMHSAARDKSAASSPPTAGGTP